MPNSKVNFPKKNKPPLNQLGPRRGLRIRNDDMRR